MNIKKIIKEEIDNFDWVNEKKTPLSWLIDNFSDLTPVVKGVGVYYINEDRVPLFYYDKGRSDSDCYISFNLMWYFLEEDFNLNEEDVASILTKWLGDVYQITDHKPIPADIWTGSSSGKI
jgi:hypothetical protein